MLLIVVISIVTNIILFYYLYFFLFIVTTIYYYYKQGTWLQKIFKIYFLYIFIYFFKLYYVIPHFYSPPKTEVCSSSSFLPLSSDTPNSLPLPLPVLPSHHFIFPTQILGEPTNRNLSSFLPQLLVF